MPKDVSLQIKATDGASSVFQRIGQAATKTGKDVDAASQTAASSMSRFEQATAKAEAATSRLGISASTVGKTLGAGISAGLLLSVKATADAQVSQERLQTTIEATGALYEQYGAQIDALNSKALSLSFDDEANQDSLNSLVAATQDVTGSIDQMGLAMDIARGRGIDLASATKIIIAADQERFGALQRLGIQIDSNATKESVLADLQARYAGQAQAYADTNAGAFDRWTNSIENWAEAAGAALGPAQQLLLVFPGLAAGASTFSTAISGLTASAAGAEGAIGIAGLAGTAGIAGLGIAAAVAATGGVGLLLSKLEVDTPKAAGDASKSIDELIQKALELDNIGAIGSDLLDIQAATAYNDAIIELTDHVNELMDIGYTVQREGSKSITDSIFAGFSEGALEVLDRNGDLQISFDELDATVNALTGDNMAMAQSAADMNTMLAKSKDEIDAIMRLSGPGAERAKEALDNLLDAYMKSPESVGNLEEALQGVIQTFHDTQAATLDANGALADGVNGWTAHTQAVTAANAAMQNYFDTVDQPGAGQSVADSFGLDDEWLRDLDKANAGLQGYLDIEQQIAGAAVDAGPQIKKFMDELSGLTGSKSFGGEFKFDANFGTALGKTDALDAALKDLADQFGVAQDAATQASTALDNVFRAAVSNTNAIAQNSQSVQDWADNLIGAEGTYGKIDDLLQDGKITLDQYTAAQQSYNVIAEANARVQESILAIQAQQAPVIATAEQAMADYWESLAGAGTDAQLFALGMADSTTAMEALSLAQSYLQDQDTFGPMIESAAKASPYLAQILEEMHLISYDPATGEVELLGADDAQSDLDRLNDTMGRLNNQIATLVAMLDDQASTPLEDIEIKLGILDDMTATPTANLEDNASGTLGTIAGLLTSLDGRSVTTYVNTVSTFSGSSISPLGYDNGGTIPAMAIGGTSAYGYSKAAKNGLTATLVGERGPEVLMLPGGAQVMNTEGSRERWGGEPKIEVHVHVAGSVVGVQDLAEEVSKPIVDAIRQSAARQRQSVGARR